jgi:hypothetical protein
MAGRRKLLPASKRVISKRSKYCPVCLPNRKIKGMKSLVLVRLACSSLPVIPSCSPVFPQCGFPETHERLQFLDDPLFGLCQSLQLAAHFFCISTIQGIQ